MKNAWFHASIVLYTFQYVLSISNIEFSAKDIIGKCSLYVSILLCLLHIAANIKKKSKLKIIALFIVFLGIGVTNYYIIGFSFYLVFFLYIISARFCKMQSIYMTLLLSMGLFFSVNALLAVLHIIPMGEKQAGRFGMGLNNYVLGFYAFHCSLIILYLCRNIIKKNKYIYILLILLNTIVFLATKTRLTLIISLVTVAMSYAFENVSYDRKGKKIVIWIFPFLFVMEYLMVCNYRRIPKINSLLSGRLGFQNRALEICGTYLFPRAIHYSESNLSTGGTFIFYIDSGYMDLYVKFGIIMLILTLGFYTYMLYLSVKQEKTTVVVWLISVAIFNFINTSFFNVLLDSSVLLIWELLDDKKLKTVELKIKNILSNCMN
jgi:hypothetical protein